MFDGFFEVNNIPVSNTPWTQHMILHGLFCHYFNDCSVVTEIFYMFSSFKIQLKHWNIFYLII